MRVGKGPYAAAGVSAALPAALLAILSRTRPDFVDPMFKHAFGLVTILGAFALAVFGAALLLQGFWLVARFVPQDKTALRVAAIYTLWAASFVACTLPALALILVGPVVFAFTFGDVRSPAP